MLVYAVERCEDDFYADFALVKIFKKIGDARNYCNKQLLAELLEDKRSLNPQIKIDHKTQENQVYGVHAQVSTQELKLTKQGEWFHPDVQQLGSQYRVCILEVE